LAELRGTAGLLRDLENGHYLVTRYATWSGVRDRTKVLCTPTLVPVWPVNAEAQRILAEQVQAG